MKLIVKNLENEAPPEVKLVKVIEETAPSGSLGEKFHEDCTKSIEVGDVSALITAIVHEQGAVAAIATLETNEAIAAMAILAALITKASEPGVLAKPLVTSLIAHGDPKDTENAKHKIRLLSVLYNLLSDVGPKCDVLLALFGVAATHASEFLAPHSFLGQLLVKDTQVGRKESAFDNIKPLSLPLVELLNALKASNQTKRELYTSIARALPKQDERRQSLWLLASKTYAGDTNVDAEGLQVAHETAVGAIRDPVSLFIYQRDSLQLRVIDALKSHDAQLFGLLQVFLEGTIADYLEYTSANGGEDALLKKYDLDPSSCQSHMRILSLCTLAAEKDIIDYDELSQYLRLQESDDVERWVIDTVGSGLLDAKLDQMSAKVIVRRAKPRKLGPQEWSAMRNQLAAWKSTVEGLITSLEKQ